MSKFSHFNYKSDAVMDSEYIYTYIYYTPNKHSDAQPLVEYEDQLPWEENKKNGECHAIAYGFLLMCYKYKIIKYSHYDIFTFHVMNTFLSDSGTLLLREK